MATEIRLPAGATEQDIAAAIAQLPSGGTIILPSDETIEISQGLKINVSSRDVTIDLNGSTLQQAGNVSVIWGFGSHKTGQSATLEDAPADRTVVTYAGASALKVGDYVKIYSDDVLRNDFLGAADPTRLGQTLEVLAVDGDTVTLEGELLYREDYQTNIRASAYASGELVIKNGTIEGDQAHPDWIADLVNLRTTIDAKIDHLTVQNGNAMGINIIDSVNATVTDAVAKNLRDNPSLGQLGYGVHSAASVGTTVIGLYTEHVRHATDDNSVSVPVGHPNPSRYGADIGMTVLGAIAYDSSSFAYSWHSEGRENLIKDSMAFNAVGLIGARGVDNSMVDSYGVNTARGIQFYEAGDGDAYGFVFNGLHVKEATVDAFMVTGSPHNNIVANSVFEVTGRANDPGTAATLVNTRVESFVTDFDEVLFGTDEADVLLGGQGVDAIWGGADADYIWGGSSFDFATGGGGRDYFAFHRMDDAGDVISDFQGGASGDFLDLSVIAKHHGWRQDLPLGQYVRFASFGSDVFVQVDVDGGGDNFANLVRLENIEPNVLSSTNIVLELPWGTDVEIPAGTPDQIEGGDLADTLHGTDADDTLSGGFGPDRLEGGNGNDLLDGGEGADKLIGGAGTDTASYASGKSGVTADLGNATSNTGDAAGDTYSQVENLSGSASGDILRGNGGVNAVSGGRGADQISGMDGADTLHGDAGNDMLDGGLKNDALFGDAGNDWLEGGKGYDRLTGGSGADSFVFMRPDDQTDIVADFSHAEGDMVVLNSSAFGGLDGGSGDFLVQSDTPKAESPDPWLLYNTTTGYLSYDADGSGAGATVPIAKFENAPFLFADEFMFLA